MMICYSMVMSTQHSSGYCSISSPNTCTADVYSFYLDHVHNIMITDAWCLKVMIISTSKYKKTDVDLRNSEHLFFLVKG